MSIDKNKVLKAIKISAVVLGTAFVGMEIAAYKKKPDSVYENEPEEKNPMEGRHVRFVADENDLENADGVRGHLVDVGEEKHSAGIYEKFIKRGLDVAMSFGGLVVFSPILGAIALAIKIDDPGPALFVQKRVGQNKKYFKLHKFRSMKMSTPHDVPTHMLDNPDQYITRVGKFIRAHSLDELPQIWDIFLGNMSVIGPRPALWNQDVLTSERDKYGANDVKPGLTGWAQINGRDELSLAEKSKFDGVYTKALEAGGAKAAEMDAKCFLGSLHVFNGDASVVEGGTGGIEKKSHSKLRDGIPAADPPENFASDYEFSVNTSDHKKVLIVGANSYIGESFKSYAEKNYPDNFTFRTVDTLPGEDGKSELDLLTLNELGSYDIIYHLAGIAHADIGNVSDETKEKYYRVNTDLAVSTARRYKEALISSNRSGKFVFMSSMIVYGDSAPYGVERVITKEYEPNPANFYGDSKWQADKGIRALADRTLRVAVIRPPMIYGKGSKGNYSSLSKLARKLPVFPDVENRRSMLYIGNLCEFLCQMFLSVVDDSDQYTEIENPNSLIFMPQNEAFTRTSTMVKLIAETAGHHISLLKGLNPAVALADHVPGKVKGLVDKAFGNNAYDQKLSEYRGLDYKRYTFEESIRLTESKAGADAVLNCRSTNDSDHPGTGRKVLIIASVASMIDQFNKPNIELLNSLGYDVDVAANFKNPGTITISRCQELLSWLADHSVDCYQVDFDRNVADLKADSEAFKEVDAVFKGTATPIFTVSNDGKNVVNTTRRHLESRYTFMHCHSPIGGVIGRIVAHRNHVKAIYTAHGFHFYDGAPIKNWILFYPVEKELSRWTDVLITINKEDYKRAKKKFHAKKVVKIPGVGVDTARFDTCHVNRNAKRAELGIPTDAFVLLSVGELSERKNQRVVLEAIKKLSIDKAEEYSHIYYLCVGQGELEGEYNDLIHNYGISDHVKLLGFRADIGELCETVDCFVHPSVREGLGIAPLEAMASGLPLISTYVNGIKDYTENGKSGVCITDPMDVDAMVNAIIKMYKEPEFRKSCGTNNYETAKNFDINRTDEIMSEIYRVGGDINI